MAGGEEHVRTFEIRIHDTDDPQMANEALYLRTLTASLFRGQSGTVNLVIDLKDPDGDNHGGAGINVALDQLEELVRFVRENQYDA